MRPRPTVSMIVTAVVLAASAAFAQQGAVDGQWRSFAGDLGSTKYSTLDQIDADNVGTLRVAWRRPLVDAAYLAVDPEVRFSSVSLAAPLIALGIALSWPDRLPRLFGLGAAIGASLFDMFVVWIWHAPVLHESAATTVAIFG